jgi:hypothetical protein
MGGEPDDCAMGAIPAERMIPAGRTAIHDDQAIISA